MPWEEGGLDLIGGIEEAGNLLPCVCAQPGKE